MQSKGNAPNKAQKDFRENLRSLYPGSEIHHPVGTTGKHNKIHIGHWWILAISLGEHNMAHAMGKARKSYEKEVFQSQMRMYFNRYFQMPVPDAVLEAIQDYHL